MVNAFRRFVSVFGEGRGRLSLISDINSSAIRAFGAIYSEFILGFPPKIESVPLSSPEVGAPPWSRVVMKKKQAQKHCDF